jgi:hypothetical protein
MRAIVESGECLVRLLPAVAPRLARGQDEDRVLGRIGLGTDHEQEALAQAAPLPAARGGSRDFRRDGDERQQGLVALGQVADRMRRATVWAASAPAAWLAGQNTGIARP